MKSAAEAPGWDATLYLKYGDERTRPGRDLVAQVPLADPRLVYDLGCGPGNSTALLAERFPRAEIIGLDSSPDMLTQARRALPAARFEAADLATWRPQRRADLLFSNAVFQWVPNHRHVLAALMQALASGGCLAVQVPDNLAEPAQVLIRDIAEEGAWSKRLAGAEDARQTIAAPQAYYDLLRPFGARIDIWQTIYQHALADAPAIVEWMKATALRPYLALLDAAETQDFLAAYTERIAGAYPPCADGKVLLRFPRLFLVAIRA